LHQQIRKLTKSNPDSVVTGEVIEVLPNSTSSAAKSVETRLLQEFYESNGFVPPGNIKSFKPTP
jgi:hypothetical protein